jgi:hypothetical protein
LKYKTSDSHLFRLFRQYVGVNIAISYVTDFLMTAPLTSYQPLQPLATRTSVQVFEDLVNEQILLLPFTVDHLGGIGTLAYHLLFGPHENKQAPTPTTTRLPKQPQATASSYSTTWPMANMHPLT